LRNHLRKENTMKLNSFMRNSSVTAVAYTLGLAILGSPAADVRAAELQVLAGGGISVPLKELAAEFERTSGHKLSFASARPPN
jgi:molybdate transport system substrate-binding protein